MNLHPSLSPLEDFPPTAVSKCRPCDETRMPKSRAQRSQNRRRCQDRNGLWCEQLVTSAGLERSQYVCSRYQKQENNSELSPLPQCDAARPRCSPCANRDVQCTYSTKNSQETRQEALRRENQELRKEISILRSSLSELHSALLEKHKTRPESSLVENKSTG